MPVAAVMRKVPKNLQDVLRAQKLVQEVTPESRGYPSTVKPNAYGKCLVAAQDLPAGTIAEKFEGEVRFDQLFFMVGS